LKIKSRDPKKKLLTAYRMAAKAEGVKNLRGGENGGGWVVLASACGGDDITNKVLAKRFLASRFPNVRPAEISVIGTNRATSKKKEWKPRLTVSPHSDAFLSSYEWRRTRMQVLKRDGARCACCGASPADGLTMHVDHIKPRRIFPQLALDLTNLQVLCEVCNHGKGNWDMTDWRGSFESIIDPDLSQHIRSIVVDE
jgi:hypothetical protein